jgi:SPP1 gp7 family putative phage head morphogenesis protein
MPKQPPLTKQKAKWVQGRNVALRGHDLRYNASQQEKYLRSLNRLVDEMTSEVKKQLVSLFKGQTADQFFTQQQEASAMDASIASQARILMNALTDKFLQLFSYRSKSLAERMVKGASAVSKTNLHTSLKQLSGGLSLKTGVVPAGMEDVAKASVAENVSLIQSIPVQYLKDVTGSVMRSIITGNGLADLVPDLTKYSGQTTRRVKNLALDQTRKAYNSINKQRMQSIGVKQFEWVHSGGGQKPRESHLAISGHIFDFDNLESQQAELGVPPEDRGIPGHPINCRCTMLPVIKFEDE